MALTFPARIKIADKEGLATPEFLRVLRTIVDSVSVTGAGETVEGDIAAAISALVVGDVVALDSTVQPRPPEDSFQDVAQPAPSEQTLPDINQPPVSECCDEMVLQQQPLGTIATENIGTNFTGDLGGMTTTVVNGIITSVV